MAVPSPTFSPVVAARSHSLVTVAAEESPPDPAVVSHELGQDAAQGKGGKLGARRGPGPAAAPPPPHRSSHKGILSLKPIL